MDFFFPMGVDLFDNFITNWKLPFIYLSHFGFIKPFLILDGFEKIFYMVLVRYLFS
jgi:hypothetical protein